MDVEHERHAPELISVVIPVRNGASVIAEQLDALSEQRYDGDWEVVVADNGSVDSTTDIVRSYCDRLPRLRLVDAAGNGGASRARNLGAAAAVGDLLAFCDADDVADPGWLAGIAAAARTADLVGGWLDEERLNDPVVRAWRPAHQMNGQLDRPNGFRPAASSANFAIWADVLAAVGGWREDYVHGHEDTELCWRAQRVGYRLVAAPGAVMAYRHRAGLRDLARQSFYYGMVSARLFRDHRRDGMPRSSVRVALGAWRRTFTDLPALSDPVARGRWVRRSAFHAGRLVGSLRHRVLFL